MMKPEHLNGIAATRDFKIVAADEFINSFFYAELKQRFFKECVNVDYHWMDDFCDGVFEKFEDEYAGKTVWVSRGDLTK